ncbi:ExbD/TolR family protein [Brevundimonas sp.]|uniref:ExbD/TolR family protein n=1 Tax=Brevundimonas sp. TaxID=1871086 RepID=UPI0037C19459
MALIRISRPVKLLLIGAAGVVLVAGLAFGLMIAAPLATATVAVDLPQTEAAPQRAALGVHVRADGTVSVEGQTVELSGLVERLVAVGGEDARERIVQVSADSGVAYEAVMRVMRTLGEAGFRKVGLSAETGA